MELDSSTLELALARTDRWVAGLVCVRVHQRGLERTFAGAAVGPGQRRTIEERRRADVEARLRAAVEAQTGANLWVESREIRVPVTCDRMAAYVREAAA